jgi:hypothetical protein
LHILPTLEPNSHQIKNCVYLFNKAIQKKLVLSSPGLAHQINKIADLYTNKKEETFFLIYKEI